MKKRILLLFIAALPLIATAQENYAYLAWDYNIPLANKEWLDSSSPHGGVLGLRYFVKDRKIAVGLDVAWTTYDQYEPTQTFWQDNGAVTTDYYKYIYQYAALATGQYFFGSGESEIFFPYVSLGLGASHNRFTLYYNIYEEQEKKWAFAARSEVGAIVKFGKYRSAGAIAAAHMDYSTAKSDNYNYSSFSAVGFKLGIVLMSRY